MTHTNRLAAESSPYLLQHAHNPVDWFAWGDEAFAKARAEDKPVLVSIGYAACHWCHVMERESFEDEETAALMNEKFINIKVDREERPDVDGIYMDAVQAIGGSGGWPLNVFVTPEGKPFYGGTYFPPQRAFNRASWTEVLEAIANAYATNRQKIDTDAETLTQHLQQSGTFAQLTGSGALPDALQFEEAFAAIMKAADEEWGGFGRAPKFPQTFTILFLLRYAHLTGNPEARAQALLSLDKMAQGGLYDHLGGGFARYSTDAEWLAPHFEKMLYDTALLLPAYAEAYQQTADARYRDVIFETVTFAERELLHPDGGFYSALDADSEGEEGRFYVWTFEKVAELLGVEAPLFCDFYGITPAGNWEEKNILFVKTPLHPFAQSHGLDVEDLKGLLARGRQKLFAQRATRVRPGLDDKVLLSWNALMNAALSKAYAATGHVHFKTLAVRNMQFLLQAFAAADGRLYHVWKGGTAKHMAFIDDYAYLINALLLLNEVSGDTAWLEQAAALAEVVMADFSDGDSPLFYFTSHTQTDILLRKKEVYDGATPSGNAVMADALSKLGILLGRSAWFGHAQKMLAALAPMAIKYPTSFGVWLSGLLQQFSGLPEIAVVGPAWEQVNKEVLALYIPFKVQMAAPAAVPRFPLLAGKPATGSTAIYLCENYACKQPVDKVEALREQLAANILHKSNNW